MEAISAWVFMQMLQAGFAAVGEFHYLHHQPNGRAYDELAALSQRVAAAAQQTGIGLTLLPVLYPQGGCDGRALNDWQGRFANDTDRFCKLLAGAADAVAQLDADSRTGIAPHSLRAVPAQADDYDRRSRTTRTGAHSCGRTNRRGRRSVAGNRPAPCAMGARAVRR